MPPGKAAAKLIQASIVSLSKASIEVVQHYLMDGEGTQIVLLAADEVALRRAYNEATQLGLPCSMACERNIVMACAIGPVMKEVACHITGGLRLMP